VFTNHEGCSRRGLTLSGSGRVRVCLLFPDPQESVFLLVQRVRVIVADDSHSVRAALRRILEPHCDVVATAFDGVELLRLVRTFLPDVVVTDIDMPRMDGLDACRQIRLHYPAVRVIIISGLPDDSLVASAEEAGASTMIYKPHMADKLTAAVLAK
jgi:CheY-like chemotaxis protein